MYELKNLDILNPQLAKTITPYAIQLLNTHKDNIISIALTGNVAGKNYIPKVTNITLLVVFKELGFKELEKSLTLISKGMRQRISAPLFLTRTHLETSTDVFPIEFLEMKEKNCLIYGEDLLSSLTIDPRHIRLFCEEQIKGKLIRIRQAYLEIGLKRKGIEALLKESLLALTPTFRNLVRLKGITPSVDDEQMYLQLTSEFKVDKDVFLAIAKDIKNDEKIGSLDVEVFFDRYITQIQKLAIAVDKL